MTSTLTSQNPLSLRLVTDDNVSKQSELSLSTLTHRMRAGSDEAWCEFHRRYYLALLRYAGSRAACPADAGEIVQQAYLRIARHMKPFTDEADLWRWLACVVRCAAVDHGRGVVRRAILLEKFAHRREVQQGATAGLPGEQAANSLAHEALMKLPAKDAQLLRLKYYEGWSVNQLATDAGTTSKTIENRLARLRQRLREIIMRIQ
jgi:RNA polymerase sigma-70 factor (ECF subfamily)